MAIQIEQACHCMHLYLTNLARIRVSMCCATTVFPSHFCIVLEAQKNHLVDSRKEIFH